MDCQGTVTNKKEKTEIDKNDEYTTSLLHVSLCHFQDISLMRRNIFT